MGMLHKLQGRRAYMNLSHHVGLEPGLRRLAARSWQITSYGWEDPASHVTDQMHPIQWQRTKEEPGPSARPLLLLFFCYHTTLILLT
jgi:hypothetical protein